MSTHSREFEPTGEEIPVWDPLVRIGHWALAAAFIAAYLSGDDEGTGPNALHLWAGYTIAGVVVVRVLWGFVGPRHARFTDFVAGPRASVRYLFDLALGRARRHLGHSPAGGAMVIALLVCLTGTALTGLVAYGERGGGPLAGGRPAPAAAAQAASARQDNDEDEIGEERTSVIAGVHGALANITLALVVLHIGGVALASVVHRESLVRAMITGGKRRDA